MRKVFLISIVVILACGVSCAAATVQEIVNLISQSSWQSYLTNLPTHTGQSRVWDTGASSTHNIYGAQHEQAAESIFLSFRRSGWTTYYDPFVYTDDTGKVWSGRNIVAIKQGATNPNNIYIVGAHYDSIASRDSSPIYAPGADDNGTGVAGLLEMARVMSPYSFGATIVFAAFDAEERNINVGGVNIRRVGSMHYAGEHAADNILGMVSFDMISWNSGGSNIGRLETGWGTQNTGINAAMTTALQTYGGLSVSTNSSSNYSDHVSFANMGIPAVLLIEYNFSNNPNYHRQTDSVDIANYIDYAYGTKMLKSVCGWVCGQAGVVGGP